MASYEWYVVDCGVSDPNGFATMRAVTGIVHNEYPNARISAGDDVDWWIYLNKGEELSKDTLGKLEELPSVQKISQPFKEMKI